MNHVYAGRKPFLLIILLLSFSSFVFANTYTVTTTAAAGPGSLDQAIQDANANPGPDDIVFAIAGPPPYTITPGFPGLTAITEQVTINGYTQPGASQGTILTRTILVVINGALAGGSSDGLTVSADNVVISGLCINGFRHGIAITTSVANTHIWGNYIGTDPTGTAAAGNTGNGIDMGEAALGPGGNDQIIIGTNSDGTGDTDEGNLISANGSSGIGGWALTNSVIAGNFIGSNRFGTGAAALGNLINGVVLAASSTDNRIGTDGNNVNDIQEANGIIQNGTGITIAANSAFNIVAGNIIGINTNGDPAGNVGNGITITNSGNNRIGIDVTHANFAGEFNIISSNGQNGIYLFAHNLFGNTDNVTGNVIAGNFIGTTPTNVNRGNVTGAGIKLNAEDGVFNFNNLIGSNNDGDNDNLEGNVIAYNGAIGIVLQVLAGTDVNNGNTFSRNSIHDNGGLGIDLNGDGVTANDNGDGDTGPNDLYNFPVVTSSHGDGTNLRVTGISRPNAVIEFYLSDGSGEGATFLFRAQEGGTLNGITDGLAGTSMYSDPTYGTFTDNNFEFIIRVDAIDVPFPPGAQIVAIGIDAGNTSEFGPATTILPITLTGFKGQLVDGVVKLTWSTSREYGFSYFEVEKSLDGITYTSIGRLNGGAANGQYAFTDKTALGKANYYRLKQVDVDQHFTYSKVLIIRNDAELVVFKLSPNPISTYLNVSFKLEKDEVIRLSIFDQMGRVTKRYTLQGSRGINAFTLSDLGGLPAGNYVVEILGTTLSVKQQIIKK